MNTATHVPKRRVPNEQTLHLASWLAYQRVNAGARHDYAVRMAGLDSLYGNAAHNAKRRKATEASDAS